MNHRAMRNVRNPRLQIAIGLLILGGFGCLVSLAKEKSGSGKKRDTAKVTEEVTKSMGSESDLAAIRAESEAFVAAFNKRDAKGVAALWTADGEYTDETGRMLKGREEIRSAYADYFAENPNTKIKIKIDSLRVLSDVAAIEDGHAVVEPPPAGAPGLSKYTVFHLKVDGKWQMASVRDTHVEIPSAYNHVADLDWLIGTWTAEEHGNRMESVCAWVANKSFVERRYTTTLTDGTTTSGVQLIGWNALGGHVQSWNFSPDGGHAVGVWSPTVGGWQAEMTGVTGDGTLTGSVNLLTRLDDHTYVWQSVQRTAGGVTLPDTDEIIMKRETPR